jgi:hypothetical protein
MALERMHMTLAPMANHLLRLWVVPDPRKAVAQVTDGVWRPRTLARSDVPMVGLTPAHRIEIRR